MNEANGSKFVIRKWSIVNDQSNANYSVGNEIVYSTEVSNSNLYDYKDAYILVRGSITIMGRNFAIEVAFRNCAPFIKCITKIDGTILDDAEDLDLVLLQGQCCFLLCLIEDIPFSQIKMTYIKKTLE